MTTPTPTPETPERTPYGFYVFVVLAGLYLIVRIVQMAGWVVARIT